MWSDFDKLKFNSYCYFKIKNFTVDQWLTKYTGIIQKRLGLCGYASFGCTW